jgi:hypothetical protein
LAPGEAEHPSQPAGLKISVDEAANNSSSSSQAVAPTISVSEPAAVSMPTLLAGAKVSISESGTGSSAPDVGLKASVTETAADVSKDGVCSKPASVAELRKFHSAVRWGKSETELEELRASMDMQWPSIVDGEDDQNGNRCLHIATQNGHFGLVKFLISKCAEVNAQNKNGLTALHMSVEYDYYFQSKYLLDNGADGQICNASDATALTGIDGQKVGPEAWDAPLTVLKAATSKEQFQEAFRVLEACDSQGVDKASLAMTGMQKKKMFKEDWDPKRFADIMKRF